MHIPWQAAFGLVFYNGILFFWLCRNPNFPTVS